MSDPEIDTCTWTGCRHPVSSCRLPVSKYCYTHECAEIGCHNEAKTSGGLCKLLHACWTTGCPEGRPGTRNETKYCAIHKCREQECHMEALKPRGYCQANHACGEDDCPERRSTIKYCATHECKEPECNKKAREDGEYCVQLHSCGNAACPNRRSGAQAQTSYCVKHECEEPGCNRQARYPGRYCEQSHACGTADCKERRSGSPVDTKFCTTHQCNHDGCLAESQVPNGFCKANRHACPISKCKGPRQDDNPDGLCTQHYVEQLKEKLKEKEKKEEVTDKKEMEEQNQQKAAQPIETISPPAKEKEEAKANQKPPPQEARNEQPKSKDQPRDVRPDAKASRDSVDEPFHSSVKAQDQAPGLRSPRAGDSDGFMPVLVMMPSNFINQFTNWVNPMHLFRPSGNENREENPRWESPGLQKSLSWSPGPGGK
jgi:hypothetical protein